MENSGTFKIIKYLYDALLKFRDNEYLKIRMKQFFSYFVVLWNICTRDGLSTYTVIWFPCSCLNSEKMIFLENII